MFSKTKLSTKLYLGFGVPLRVLHPACATGGKDQDGPEDFFTLDDDGVLKDF